MHLIRFLFAGHKNHYKLLSFFVIFFLFSGWLMAQPVVVSGTIKDGKNNPVSFASVLIKGTSKGVSADADGHFKIKLNKLPAILVINAVSFQTAEQKVIARKGDSLINLTIVLEERKASLEEVVVTSSFGIKRTARSVAASTSVRVADDMADLSISSTSVTVSSAANKSRTKMLTAGELSDFKKWQLWEGYSNSEFRSFSRKWDLYANNRYTVQLQNLSSRAITGQFVYLINSSSGDTLWTAVSDNTGKAELWDKFGHNDPDDDDDELEIRIHGENKSYHAKKFAAGINFITLDRSCRVSSRVDIAFVVDATGSMGDEIDYLKEELGDILAKISVRDPSIELHTGAVFYKDSHDEYVTKVQPFTAGAQQTTDFIEKQSASGGGDYPEAVKEALEAATEKLNWSSEARTKIIFLVLDAPPHDEAKATLSALIRKAAAKGIRIVPLACSGTDKSTEFILRSIALATNGGYIFLTDDSGIGDKHIKPTTDEFKVELLNDLLLRTIAQMCYVNSCETNNVIEQPLSQYKAIDSVKVFPVPTNGPITLKTDLKLTDIFVADFTGKLLKRIDVRKKSDSYHFDIADLPAGTYFIRYITEDRRSGAAKVVLLR